MSPEENIRQELIHQFSFLENKINIPRLRRIFLEVDKTNFREVFEFSLRQLHFIHLCTISALDETDKFGLIYHLAEDSGCLLNIKTWISKEKPQVKSVINYFPGAQIYEREIADLFGIEIIGLPEGSRYPLPDDWPVGQYPLRKDWKAAT